MATTKRYLPKSIRIHIRNEKARIRAQFSDTAETDEKIRELTAKITGAYSKKEKA